MKGASTESFIQIECYDRPFYGMVTWSHKQSLNKNVSYHDAVSRSFALSKWDGNYVEWKSVVLATVNYLHPRRLMSYMYAKLSSRSIWGTTLCASHRLVAMLRVRFGININHSEFIELLFALWQWESNLYI